MGYSMGGRGTWHLAATFRSHFVAAIPIAGRPGEIALDTLRDLPLYVIHSEADRRGAPGDNAEGGAAAPGHGAPGAVARPPPRGRLVCPPAGPGPSPLRAKTREHPPP